jgi:hypothetical protein
MKHASFCCAASALLESPYFVGRSSLLRGSRKDV